MFGLIISAFRFPLLSGSPGTIRSISLQARSAFYQSVDVPIDWLPSQLSTFLPIQAPYQYDSHINKIVGKAYSRVGVLYKGFASRRIDVLRQAYVTYVRPVLEYASSVWSPHLIKHIDALERVQKQFTRRIPSLSQLTYPERLAAINLEPLELRRLRADLLLYYKSFHDLVALPSSEYFFVSEHASQTRTGGNRLIVPLCHTNRFQNEFFNRCLKCWNNLPDTVVNASSINSFKQLLTNIDLSSYLHCSYF